MVTVCGAVVVGGWMNSVWMVSECACVRVCV